MNGFQPRLARGALRLVTKSANCKLGGRQRQPDRTRGEGERLGGRARLPCDSLATQRMVVYIYKDYNSTASDNLSPSDQDVDKCPGLKKASS